MQEAETASSSRAHGSAARDAVIDRAQWGRNLRLAMACIAGPSTSSSQSGGAVGGTDNDETASASTISELRRQLHELGGKIDSNIASQVELLVRFDELEGWREGGARNCVAWMNMELGIERKLGWERLRVGRALRSLPVMQALFRKGQLSWSKIRLLSRIASPTIERDLAYMALDASVSDIERVCQEFRWEQERGSGMDAPGDDAPAHGETSTEREDRLALQQHRQRRCTWLKRADGTTEIRVLLPPADAQNVLKSLEHCEDKVYRPPESSADAPAEEQPTVLQRRADAFVLMAERSLAFGGTDLARADRFQVVMAVEAGTLTTPEAASGVFPIAGAYSPTARPPLPERRPVIEGIGPVARSTARRLACDASLVDIETQAGEPVSIGRRSRIWPASMRRAIIARDRHCQFEGCDVDRHLQIHHLVHWADGGDTSIENGVCVCHHHHVLMHEGGYRLERATVALQTEAGPGQGVTLGLESRIRRQLLPTRCRFRTVKPVCAASVGCMTTPARTSEGGTSEFWAPALQTPGSTCPTYQSACSGHCIPPATVGHTTPPGASGVEEPRGSYRVLRQGQSWLEKSTRVDHLNQRTVSSGRSHRERVGANESMAESAGAR